MSMFRLYWLLIVFAGAAACSSEQLTDLMLASGHGDRPAVVKMLDQGMDVNHATPSGKTPLMYAASEGHADVVEVLLQRGADSNAVDSEGSSALLLAATSGYDEVVKHLLDYNADPEIQNSNGGTALTHGIFFGRTKTVDLLLAKLPPLPKQEGGEYLLMAAGLGHAGIAVALIEHGVDVNSRGKLNRTPLMAAIEFDKPEVVRVLLEKGANPALQDEDGSRAADLAEEKGNPVIVELLRSSSI